MRKIPFFVQLILIAILIGVIVSIVELFVGHKMILDPLLHEMDPNFISESYFAPTYYGLTKMIAVALTFFFIYLCTSKSKMKPILKSAMVGVIGTIIFGIYHSATLPNLSFISTAVLLLVHFVSIGAITFLIVKILKFQ